jgi:ABC-type tungstate transport system substrate-binding protein
MEYVPVYILALLWISFSIWAILDISKFPLKKRMKKLVWTNIVVIFPIGGLIVYYLIGRKNLVED